MVEMTKRQAQKKTRRIAGGLRGLQNLLAIDRLLAPQIEILKRANGQASEDALMNAAQLKRCIERGMFDRARRLFQVVENEFGLTLSKNRLDVAFLFRQCADWADEYINAPGPARR